MALLSNIKSKTTTIKKEVPGTYLLFQLASPYVYINTFYAKYKIKEEQQTEFPMFSEEIDNETGERTLCIHLYEHGYPIYNINFEPFYEENGPHYLNGIRKITFLLHAKCHNCNGVHYISVYGKNEGTNQPEIKDFDITTRLFGDYPSKRQRRLAEKIEIVYEGKIPTGNFRLYSEGYENNNHEIKFRNASELSPSIPTGLRFYLDENGYIEKSGINYNYFIKGSGFHSEIDINKEKNNYYNQLNEIYPELRTCHIPAGYNINFSYTNFVHTGPDYINIPVSDIPAYKTFNEKEVLYRMLTGKIDSHLPEVRKKLINQYQFLIENVLPIGIPVTFNGFNSMKKYFGYKVTVLKLEKGTDLNTTPYGDSADIKNGTKFIKLEPVITDFNNNFDIYTYEDIKPETK